MSISKYSMQSKKYKRTKECRDNISKALTGKKLSGEHKKNLSKAKGGKTKKKRKIHRYDPEEYKRNKEKYLERQRRYRNNPKRQKAFKERSRKYSKEYNKKNKKKRRIYNKRKWKERIELLEKEVGRKRPENCEICGEKRRIVLDHSHKNGKFRGWICSRCNMTLGLVHDDVELLKKLINYLLSAK